MSLGIEGDASVFGLNVDDEVEFGEEHIFSCSEAR